MAKREDAGFGHRGRPRWFHAEELLYWALAQHDRQAKVELGRIIRLGQGISRVAFCAEAELKPDRSHLSGTYIALIATPDAGTDIDQRFAREALVLGALEGRSLAFRAPRVLGVRWEGQTTGMVQSHLPGFPLDLRFGKQPILVPWEVVARVAAAVHTTQPPNELAGYCTWRDHAEASIASCLPQEESEPELQDARAWVLSHLPPPLPSVLLHGDLLEQNILFSLEEPPALIDWEYAQLGDPAYDLAVVTRGVQRPFQTTDGMARLLEAYLGAGGTAITETGVRLHELCLLARWYRQHRSSRATDGTADNILRQLGSLLRRVSRF